MSETIEALKMQLVKARTENDKAKEYAAVEWALVESTSAFLAYKNAKDDFAIASESLLVADKALRDAALEEFGYKTVAEELSPGVTIKMRHKIIYKLEAVITWAKEEAKYLFKFDTKSFEDAAKKGTLHGAPFEKYDEPYVELATKSEDFQLPAEWLAQNNILTKEI